MPVLEIYNNCIFKNGLSLTCECNSKVIILPLVVSNSRRLGIAVILIEASGRCL